MALNMWDEAKHKGVVIDPERLEQLLGVPVVPTVAVTGEGIKELVQRLPEAVSPKKPPLTPDERWATVGRIIKQVQTVKHRHHTWLEHLQDASIAPFPGLLLAALALFLSFFIVRLIGEGLIGYIFDPLFERLWAPLMLKLSALLGPENLIHDILVGKLIRGEIDFFESFGLLTTGIYIPFGAVLPYVFSFYLVLSFLEDVGYLPRLAVLLDSLMHRLGMHGYAIIPNLLGLGCNVPGILATRILESKQERFIAATLISIGVPCAALQAMIIGLVGAEGWHHVALVYSTLFLVWVTLGLILNLTVRGFSPELLVEIPPYRPPRPQILAWKIWMRVLGVPQGSRSCGSPGDLGSHRALCSGRIRLSCQVHRTPREWPSRPAPGGGLRPDNWLSAQGHGGGHAWRTKSGPRSAGGWDGGSGHVFPLHRQLCDLKPRIGA